MYVSCRPSAPLDAVVECLWLSRRVEGTSECEHMLPSGTAQLVICLHDSPIQWAHSTHGADWQSWSRAIVHGPQSGYYLAGPKPKGTVVGASFRPGMAESILGVPMRELLDAHVPLEDLWGSRALQLRERLAMFVEPTAVLRVLESELLARMQRRPLLINPAVAYALQSDRSGRAWRVAEAQENSGYSPRHFIELFRSSVGLPPKHFYRVRRFSSALAQVAAGKNALAEVAANAGYADQSHMSREFRELAGVSPSAYRPRSPDAEHHHVAEPR